MKEGCRSDSPRLPLAETCIGSTSGNKEKETELKLGELNSANSGSLRTDGHRHKAPTAGRRAGSSPAVLEPRTRLSPAEHPAQASCLALPTALLNLAQLNCSHPGAGQSPRHWNRPALPPGLLPSKIGLSHPGMADGGRERRELKARRGAGSGCVRRCNRVEGKARARNGNACYLHVHIPFTNLSHTRS